MRIKSNYYEKGVFPGLNKDVEKALKPFPDFKEELFDKLYTFFERYFSETVRLISLEIKTAGGQEYGPESEKAEHQRKKWHDRWLASVLGVAPPYRFSWGSMLSTFDSRSMSNQIVIRYCEE